MSLLYSFLHPRFNAIRFSFCLCLLFPISHCFAHVVPPCFLIFFFTPHFPFIIAHYTDHLKSFFIQTTHSLLIIPAVFFQGFLILPTLHDSYQFSQSCFKLITVKFLYCDQIHFIISYVIHKLLIFFI